jgi:hypothetical protein
MDEVNNVYLPARPEDPNLISGKYQPQRVKTEEQDSSLMLIRSEDRINGNDFNFRIDLLTSTAHIRKMMLSKIGLPLLPQINEKNKRITLTHTDGTVSFELVEGFYSVQSMVNMMQAKFINALKTLDVTNSVTIVYDVERRAIEIIDDNSESFYIHSESDFINFGRNVVKFPSLPGGSPLPVTTSVESTSLGMIYSRFVTLESSRMIEDQRTYSVVSNKGASNIIAIIDIASAYSSAQFTVSSSFPGTDVIINTYEYAPRVNVVNRNKSFKVVDFELRDEFGFCLDELNTAAYSFEYPVFFWFMCFV